MSRQTKSRELCSQDMSFGPQIGVRIADKLMAVMPPPQRPQRLSRKPPPQLSSMDLSSRREMV